MQILSGFILLAVLIIVHEFGHFIVAKFMGVKILTFSIGFGPKLFAIKKGDTEYRISMIPLGGYIRMYGDQLDDHIPLKKYKFSFLHQPIWKKSLIAFAGPLFNFILAIVLFFFIFVGSKKNLHSVVGTVIENQPAAKAGLRYADKVISINNILIEDFNDLVKVISKNPDKSLNMVIERKENDNLKTFKKKIISTSVYKNYLNKDEKIGHIGIMSAIQKAVISVPLLNSNAANAGLKTFDQIMKINGNNIKSNNDIWPYFENNFVELKIDLIRNIKKNQKNIVQKLKVKLLHNDKNSRILKIENLKCFSITNDDINNLILQKKINKTKLVMKYAQNNINNFYGLRFVGGTISEIINSSPAHRMGLKRGDQIIALNGEKVKTSVRINKILSNSQNDIHVMGVLGQNKASIYAFRIPKINKDKFMFGIYSKAFGIKLKMSYVHGVMKDVQVGVLKAIYRSFNETYEVINVILKSLWMLVSGNVSPSQLGGPIAVFSVAGQAAKQGIGIYGFIMAIISINLGLLNLLPVPILDGGHLFMFGIEAIKGKPLSIKSKQFASRIGLLFLLIFMVWAIFNDISRLIT